MRCVSALAIIHREPLMLRQVLLTKVNRRGHALSEQRAELKELQRLLKQSASQIHCHQIT